MNAPVNNVTHASQTINTAAAVSPFHKTTVSQRKAVGSQAEQLMALHLDQHFDAVLPYGFDSIDLPLFAVQAARAGAPGFEPLRYRPDFLCISTNTAVFVEVKSLQRPNVAHVNQAEFDFQTQTYDTLFIAFVDVGNANFKAVAAPCAKRLVIDRVVPDPNRCRGSGQPYYVIDLSDVPLRPLELGLRGPYLPDDRKSLVG